MTTRRGFLGSLLASFFAVPLLARTTLAKTLQAAAAIKPKRVRVQPLSAVERNWGRIMATVEPWSPPTCPLPRIMDGDIGSMYTRR